MSIRQHTVRQLKRPPAEDQERAILDLRDKL